MVYKTYIPHALLKPYVNFFWLLEGTVPHCEAVREKILPDGCIELIIHYGDIFEAVNEKGFLETQPQVFVMGQIKRYFEVMPKGNMGVLGVRFKPGGLQAFTNMPALAFTGHAVGLEHIFGDEGRFVAEQTAAIGEAGKINLVQTLLLKKLACNYRYDFLIDGIIKKIIAQKGQVQLGSLLKNIKISERHFERQFKNTVGLNPKFFARLIRFNNIMRDARTGSSSLVTLSYLGGYYDQAHFIKDFRQFTGENPSEYFGNSNGLSSIFLNEQ